MCSPCASTLTADGRSGGISLALPQQPCRFVLTFHVLSSELPAKASPYTIDQLPDGPSGVAETVSDEPDSSFSSPSLPSRSSFSCCSRSCTSSRSLRSC